ncbi:hypothetical protein OK016_10460 [Vibrio chagasii]|nr:hypothetical protein [Vibrio chagasii]
MVDGIDGLLGGLNMVVFLIRGGVLRASSSFMPFLWRSWWSHVIHAFVLFNGLLWQASAKIVHGRCGQHDDRLYCDLGVDWWRSPMTVTHIRPVTALWLIAVPLIDMMAIMIRRIRKGHSPFKPDREHFLSTTLCNASALVLVSR